nr:hypothetical protein GTC16762_19230 [Pigmentibacter ruber]
MKNNSISTDTDVIIVGAGPVGLALANLLQTQGLRFALFTQESEPRPVYESRAEGVHVRTLELFERIGVIQKAMNQGRPLEGVSLYSLKQKLGSFSLKDPRSAFPGALILEQGKVERILSERLQENGVSIHWGHKLSALVQTNGCVEAQFVDQNGVTIRLQGKYFVGCDGAHSTSRKLIGVDFIGEPHPGSYALADVDIEWHQEALDSNVHVFMSPLLLLGKLKEGSWKVASLVPKGAKLPESPEEILSILQAQIDHHGVLAKLMKARWTSHFRISNRHVSTMRKDRVFLAGDAAHIHSPMGGQGMNEGIHDAANLAWKLALVVNGKADDSLLDTYSEERLPLIEKVLKDTSFMTNAIEIEGPGRWVRDKVVSFATQIQMLEPLLREEFSGAHRTIGQTRIIRESNVSFL